MLAGWKQGRSAAVHTHTSNSIFAYAFRFYGYKGVERGVSYHQKIVGILERGNPDAGCFGVLLSQL